VWEDEEVEVVERVEAEAEKVVERGVSKSRVRGVRSSKSCWK
jgi:hypothetical protein